MVRHRHAGEDHRLTVKIKTADETINNDDTLTDDSELQFAVDANSRYLVFMYLHGRGDVQADFKYLFTVPAGASMRRGSATVDPQWSIEKDATIVENMAKTTSLQHMEWFGFVLTGATAGDVILQWAQQNSDPDNTTLEEGCWLMAIKI